VTSPSNPFRYEFNSILRNPKKCCYQNWSERSGVVVLFAWISTTGDKVDKGPFPLERRYVGCLAPSLVASISFHGSSLAFLFFGDVGCGTTVCSNKSANTSFFTLITAMGKSRHPKQVSPTSFDGMCRGSDGVQALWYRCKSTAIVHRHIAPVSAMSQFCFRLLYIPHVCIFIYVSSVFSSHFDVIIAFFTYGSFFECAQPMIPSTN
jgi:hypothetical protein